jgi:type 1 fimbria pilin
MNMNKIVTALGFSAIMVCGSVMAAGNQGGGKVTFIGEIINAPCSVDPDSVDQIVQLGQVSTKELVTGGESDAQPFTISLRNCEIDEGLDSIKVTFSGVADPQQADLLVLGSGEAKGAGIAMTAPGGGKVELGKPTAAFKLTNGNNDLVFNAALKGYAAQDVQPLVAGSFTAVTNFVLAYE